MFPGVKVAKDIEQLPMNDMGAIRDQLYQDPTVLDNFIREKLTEPDEIATVEGWKKYIKGKFFLFRHLKKHSIFLTTEEPYRAYGALGLTNPLKVIMPQVPTVVETVLLPFEGQIVCDGLLKGGRLYFGSGMRRSINSSYEQSKAQFGIITSLDQPVQELESPRVARLKSYLKTERSREDYWDEIVHLRDQSPELKRVYCQEMGKAYGKIHSKRYREIGFKNIWVAMYAEMPIATGKTKTAVEKVLAEILPRFQHQFVYIFQLKGKK